MSLTVQQLLSDAKRLSSRLRDHDQSADQLITRAQEVLKEVDAMRQYQEDVDNLNEVAHNRPRAQLVLGIQQENRHIRTLQQENKELRAALEEHQSALELIMSKYRQHVTRLVNSPAAPDLGAINNHKNQLLAERTEKVCEMASVMKEAVRLDEETGNQQQELLARLVTENKGLREMLEISKRGSTPTIKVRRVVPSEHKEVQTEGKDAGPLSRENVDLEVTLPLPGSLINGSRLPPRHVDKSPILEQKESASETVHSSELSSGDSDETGSEDESVKYDTIKLADRRQLTKERKESRVSQGRENDAVKDSQDVIDAMKENEEIVPNLINNHMLVGSLVNQLVVDTVDVSSSTTSTECPSIDVSSSTTSTLDVSSSAKSHDVSSDITIIDCSSVESSSVTSSEVKATDISTSVEGNKSNTATDCSIEVSSSTTDSSSVEVSSNAITTNCSAPAVDSNITITDRLSVEDSSNTTTSNNTDSSSTKTVEMSPQSTSNDGEDSSNKSDVPSKDRGDSPNKSSSPSKDRGDSPNKSFTPSKNRGESPNKHVNKIKKPKPTERVNKNNVKKKAANKS